MSADINAIIDAMQVRVDALEARLDRMEARESAMAGVEPEPEYRYFKNGHTIWKMPANGLGFVRRESSHEWRSSSCKIGDFLETTEFKITAEEGEP